jgi:hypothetical protein
MTAEGIYLEGQEHSSPLRQLYVEDLGYRRGDVYIVWYWNLATS